MGPIPLWLVNAPCFLGVLVARNTFGESLCLWVPPSSCSHGTELPRKQPHGVGSDQRAPRWVSGVSVAPGAILIAVFADPLPACLTGRSSVPRPLLSYKHLAADLRPFALGLRTGVRHCGPRRNPSAGVSAVRAREKGTPVCNCRRRSGCCGVLRSGPQTAIGVPPFFFVQLHLFTGLRACLRSRRCSTRPYRCTAATVFTPAGGPFSRELMNGSGRPLPAKWDPWTRGNSVKRCQARGTPRLPPHLWCSWVPPPSAGTTTASLVERPAP